MSGGRAAAVLTLAIAFGCERVPRGPLVDGHGSARALAEAVLQAFERRDVGALTRLAVTEEEFRDVVWPGLPAARPERNLPFSYVWGDLRQKSAARLAESLAVNGGHRLSLVGLDYLGGTTRYPSFTVHRGTVLVVRRPDGAEERLRLYGSTWEIAGRFKVFSYVNE